MRGRWRPGRWEARLECRRCAGCGTCAGRPRLQGTRRVVVAETCSECVGGATRSAERWAWTRSSPLRSTRGVLVGALRAPCDVAYREARSCDLPKGVDQSIHGHSRRFCGFLYVDYLKIRLGRANLRPNGLETHLVRQRYGTHRVACTCKEPAAETGRQDTMTSTWGRTPIRQHSIGRTRAASSRVLQRVCVHMKSIYSAL